jgi:3-oxoacyl-[acyl-carrier-protein] synthase-3
MRRTAAVTAVGHYLPETRLTNADLEKRVDTTDEWIRTRTGIRERRILREPGKATSFMATEAAMEALTSRGMAPSDVEAIIVATVTPDMVFPPTAGIVQHSIGATHAWGFDIEAACSGFLFALTVGAKLVEGGKHDRVLVIGADMMSTIIDPEERATVVLFGDGAGAVLLEPDYENHGVLDSVEYIDGSGVPFLHQKAGGSLRPPSHETVDRRWHYAFQDGQPVFKQAVVKMAEAAAEIMARNNLEADDVRYLVPHQANLRIIDATARRMGLDSSKVMLNIERYGNTTAATIPLCLYDWEPVLRRGDNLVLAAFGGGFTWGATWLKWGYEGKERAGGRPGPEELVLPD